MTTLTNEKFPILQLLQDAATTQEQADILLRCPDAFMLKYEQPFVAAVPHAGMKHFIVQRCAAMRATRSPVGGLPGGMALELETMRAELAALAAGAPIMVPTTGAAAQEPPYLDI